MNFCDFIHFSVLSSLHAAVCAQVFFSPIFYLFTLDNCYTELLLYLECKNESPGVGWSLTE
jgi:hypothetical protein